MTAPNPLNIPLAALVALAAPTFTASTATAADSSTPPRDCIYVRDIAGFSAPDDHTVYLRVGVKEIYRLDLMGSCLNLDWRQAIGLESVPGGSWVCSPLDATVVYHENGIRNRCPVTAIHKLSADEVSALPKGDRP